MQHRNAYHPPNTPSFSIDTAPDSNSPTSSAPYTPSPTRSQFSPARAAMHADSKDPGYFVGENPSSASTSGNPYPPPTSQRFLQPTHDYSPLPHESNSASSSVHLPLLSANGHPQDFDLPESSLHARRIRSNSLRSSGGASGAASGANPLTWITTLATTRTRVHPLVLVPVFVLGAILSMTLGQKATAAAASRMSALKSFSSTASTPNYTIHSSGHLFLSPSALHPASPSSPFTPAEMTSVSKVHSLRHPIHELILNATRQWENKLARQSQTLAEAVAEYKRRFDGRNPPKGFDKWFKFAQDNKVVLIDEFEQTYTDVLPFWSLPPHVIRERANKLQLDQSTFTMLIKPTQGDSEEDEEDNVEIIGNHAEDGRARDQKKLMKRWAKWVEGERTNTKSGGAKWQGVNITMAAHDGPSIMLDDKARRRHLAAAKAGKFLQEDEYEMVDEDAALWGFPLACPANSRLRRAYDGLEIDNLPKGPSFVADHVQTMNLCENPEWQYLHGFTSWPGMRPQILRPLFSFAKTSLHSDILLTPLEQYWDREPWDPKWEDKPYNKAVWRGSTTGVWFDRGTWWRSSQRVRLWFMGKDKTGHKNVRFSTQGLETPIGVDSLIEKRVPTQELMQRYVDFAFTGKAGQCSEEDGSCQAVRDLFDFQRTFGWNEANEYKYMLDLDGNAWSGRFHRLLSTNSVVLKSTIFPEWYASWIQPWVHYIPIKIDYTDLFDVMAFFSGDLDGQNDHEHLAKQIADNGKDYTERFWRYEDMEAYFFRLSLEWARVTAEDRESMDYEGPGV